MNLKKKFRLPLDEFINFSLYHKKFGYYMKKNPFGKKGDFITAPNISRLFSESLAIWIISFWQSLGSPKKFNIIELGAGNGEMMKILIESFKKFPSFNNACNFVIHEKSPMLRKIQKKKLIGNKIFWLSKFENLGKFPCIFLANEFFDSLAICFRFGRTRLPLQERSGHQGYHYQIFRRWRCFAQTLQGSSDVPHQSRNLHRRRPGFR